MQEEEAIRRLPLGPPSALTPFPVLIWAPGAVGRGSPGQGTAVQVLLGTGGSHIAGFSLIEFLGKQVSYGVGVIKESSSWTEMLYCPLDGLGGQRMTFGTKKNFSFSP